MKLRASTWSTPFWARSGCQLSRGDDGAESVRLHLAQPADLHGGCLHLDRQGEPQRHAAVGEPVRSEAVRGSQVRKRGEEFHDQAAGVLHSSDPFLRRGVVRGHSDLIQHLKLGLAIRESCLQEQ